MNITLMEPLVLRRAGLPFTRLQPTLQGDALWALLDDAAFVDCLATMHHGALPSLLSRRGKRRPGRRPSDIRRAELTLYRYLTRFCSRNDTTGTAGTTIWGCLGDGETEAQAGRVLRRAVWPSPRHVEYLSHRAAYGELRHRASLVLVARLAWTGAELWDTHVKTRLTLSTDASALVARVAEASLCYGTLGEAERAVADDLLDREYCALRLGPPSMDRLEIARVLAEGTALEPDLIALQALRQKLEATQGLAFAKLMEEADRIVERLAPCPTLDFAAVEEKLAAMDAVSRQRISRLLRAARPSAPVWVSPVGAEARLEEALGAEAPSVRSKDRSFFICDSTPVDGTLVLGNGLRERLAQALAPWFRLVAWQEYQRERGLQRILASMPQREMALSSFLHEVSLRRLRQKSDYQSAELNAWRAALLTEDDAQWTVQGDAASLLYLEEHRCHDGFETWLQDKRFISAVDFMLGGRTATLAAGGGSVIIHEAHCGGDGLAEPTLFAQAHADRSLKGHAAALMGSDMLVLQPASIGKQAESILLQLQDAVLAINNVEGAWPQSRSRPVSGFRVRPVDGGWELHDGEQPYRMISDVITFGDIRTVCASPSHLARWACSKIAAAASGPVESTPELRLGSLVLARRKVKLLASHAAQLLANGLLEETLQLPRHCFAVTRGKPWLVDFAGGLSREVLAAELARGDTVSFSPMQPAPDALWLEGYTSEIRVIVSCDGEAYRPQSLLLRS